MNAMRLTGTLDPAPVSYEDYLAWPETNTPVEFVDGYPVVSPSPTMAHQLAVGVIYRVLHTAAPVDLRVVLSPLDWILRRSPLLVRQPDVLVVAAEQTRAPRLVTPPLLAVEIVSATSREQDLVTKRREYGDAGLPWYWLASLDTPQIVVLRNDAGQFTEYASARDSERLVIDQPFRVALSPTDLFPSPA